MIYSTTTIASSFCNNKAASLICARNAADSGYCWDRRQRYCGVTDRDLDDDCLILDEIGGQIAALARAIASAHRRASFIEAGPVGTSLIEQFCDIADDVFDPVAATLVRTQARLDGCE